MTTTTKLADYLGRALVNDNPGASSAKDYMGRDVIASNKDYIGRALTDAPLFPPPNRANTTAYSVGDRVRVAGVNEVETITVTATANNYKLGVTNRGQTLPTDNILYSSNGAAITAAIEALPNVEPGDIVVTGSSSPYTVTIQSEQGNVTQLAVLPGSPDITGGTVVVATTTQGSTGGEIYEATVAGTTGGSVPTLPAVGDTVVDGTVTWKRLT